MKTSFLITFLVTAAAPALLHAQGGSLTPPAGPIGPVMKTLDQIEARIPVNAETCPGNASNVHVISQAGSYYLTGNVIGEAGKAGILLNAQGITLDLNGFSIVATANSTRGIVVGSIGGPIAIRNGFIRFWPQGGIQFTQASDFTIENIMIYSVQGRGIDALGRGSIERVSVHTAKDFGIYCEGSGQVSIRDCRVESITSTVNAAGIYASKSTITGCAVAGVTSSASNVAGIQAPDGNVANCSVRNITMTGTGRASGIQWADNVNDCAVSSITGNGGASTTTEVSGIFSAGIVKGCEIHTINGGPSHPAWGIASTFGVDQCTVVSVTGSGTRGGIQADRVSNSTVRAISGGTGISGRNITSCHIRSCGTGIKLEQEALGGAGFANGNTIEECTSIGIAVFGKTAHVTGNNVTGDGNTSAGGTGILALPGIAILRVDGNTVARWTKGISAPSSNMLVVRNSAGLNGTNFEIHASMPVVLSTALGTNPNANISQ